MTIKEATTAAIILCMCVLVTTVATKAARNVAATDAWQEKHGLTFTGFQFKASRNQEYIPPKPVQLTPEPK